MLVKEKLFIIFYIVFSSLLAEQAESRKGRTLIFPPTSPTRAQLIYGIGIPLPLEYESMTTGYVLKAEYFLPTTAIELRPLKLHPQPVSKRHINSKQSFENNTQHYTDDYNDESTLNYIEDTRNGGSGNIGKYRWAIYRVVETIGARLGLEGRVCMLRSICEAAETPFHYSSGLLGELLHIIMTPSSSNDPISKHSDNEYFHAEYLGRDAYPFE
ncbi:unnamed protein product [Hermetia illucens]|uniref:Uncharacterized protein n=1 Tax=Hermetia illucens TaxID=343691 RepID=A0A7R8UUT9_HERIL|nr:unnamed protein product [Hermetia illucens]